MDDELIDELQQYPQIGEIRAQEIVQTVREHDIETREDHLEQKVDLALTYAREDDYEYAMKVVREIKDELAG
jgi:hypothetical protein